MSDDWVWTGYPGQEPVGLTVDSQGRMTPSYDEVHLDPGLSRLYCRQLTARLTEQRERDMRNSSLLAERSLPQCNLCGDRIVCFGPPPHATKHPGPTCEQCYAGKTRAAKRVRRSMLRADYRERARHGR